MSEAIEKTCGNCVNCCKGGSLWSCENWDGGVGWPVNCTPPYDEACSNWSDDPADIDKASDALRDFVDHFWDEDDGDDWLGGEDADFYTEDDE